MRLIMCILISVCIYLSILLTLRHLGMEAEVFDFVGRLVFIIGLIYTVQPIADLLNSNRE